MEAAFNGSELHFGVRHHLQLEFQLQLGTSRNVRIFSISEMKAPLNRCPSADPFGLSGVFPGTRGLGKQLHTPGGGRASWAAGLKYEFTAFVDDFFSSANLILA